MEQRQVIARITALSLAEAERLSAVEYSPGQRELVLIYLEDSDQPYQESAQRVVAECTGAGIGL